MYRPHSFRSDGAGLTLPEMEGGGNSYTVLIGPNGTGKSQLLGDIVREEIRRFERESPQNVTQTDEPSRVLALSNLVTDRFPFRRGTEGKYRYLGLRQASNAMYSGAVAASLGTFWLQFQLDQVHEVNLDPVFEFLNMPSFSIRVTNRFRPDPDRRRFESYAKYYLGNLDPLVAKELPLHLSEFAYKIESADPQALKHFAQAHRLSGAQLIEMLRRIYGIRFEMDFGGYNPSAGQALLLSMALRISSNIVPGSLVLIDEPEVGLHPKWQSGYIGLLRAVVPESFGCHFIIATHSPYLALDATNLLVPASDGIFQQLGFDHRGLSVEDIIYRVFETRVLGSAAVEKDLVRVLAWLSDPGSHEENSIVLAVSNLRGVADSGTRTLNRVLDQVDQRLGALS